jgi:hypothetical protein
MRHRLFRVLSAYLQKALGVAVRAAVTTFVLGVFVVSLLHYLGVPLPTAQELLHGFERLPKLAKVFS